MLRATGVRLRKMIDYLLSPISVGSCPGARKVLHLRRLGTFAFAGMLTDRHMHAVIARGQHIRLLARKHQEHVRFDDP